MSGRVTLQQVAEAAGVSRGTASVILNDRASARFAADTARRVRETAQQLGYRPNRLATALLQGGTQTLALVSADVSGDHFAADLVRGASQAAGSAGQLLYVAQSDGRPELFDRLLHQLIDQGVDGFVYAASSYRRLPIPQVLQGHPLVLLNALPAPATGPGPRSRRPHNSTAGVHDDSPAAVVPDDEQAGRLAGSLLRGAMAARGRTDGVLLLGRVVHGPTAEDPSPGMAGELRERGLRADLGEHKIPLTHLECLWWPTQAREALDAYLRSNPVPGAICALNDRVAMGAYDALRRHSLHIPDDVPVVSFDGSDLAAWLDPALSSLSLPYLQMGARAIELLLHGDQPPGALIERIPLELPHPSSLGAPLT
ncbi:LacI family transcriptional regulator [Kineosphaera limosa]|uniref:LacI family DNA-binding transcriptional regulator n=1 Tax=Kineosphaera limosa TaxID=111564 RepID=UPI0014615971|nr:LacI family DNA-binding transcriptional regulator [Kineosphaera limosa]NYD98858.1 LacI family transcriptional regulator [Kineosphaera limosa]